MDLDLKRYMEALPVSDGGRGNSLPEGSGPDLRRLGLGDAMVNVGITTGDTRCAQRHAFTSIFMKSVVLRKCSSTL
jgi:hypothetical protein